MYDHYQEDGLFVMLCLVKYTIIMEFSYVKCGKILFFLNPTFWNKDYYKYLNNDPKIAYQFKVKEFKEVPCIIISDVI